jgi:hypothetical protein
MGVALISPPKTIAAVIRQPADAARRPFRTRFGRPESIGLHKTTSIGSSSVTTGSPEALPLPLRWRPRSLGGLALGGLAFGGLAKPQV